MISLCAVFEGWYIEDGGYPPLKKGQKVNLSFKMFCHDYEITVEELYVFEQIKNAEYNFAGRIIYKYSDIIVVDTLPFKFYIEAKRDNAENIRVGQFIKGKGDIHLDPYVWVLSLDRYENHPNIFYSFVVENILKIVIAKKHFRSEGRKLRFPCSLRNDKYTDYELIEIDRMDSDDAFVFYLLNLKEIIEEIKKTSEKLFDFLN